MYLTAESDTLCISCEFRDMHGLPWCFRQQSPSVAARYFHVVGVLRAYACACKTLLAAVCGQVGQKESDVKVSQTALCESEGHRLVDSSWSILDYQVFIVEVAAAALNETVLPAATQVIAVNPLTHLLASKRCSFV